MSEHILIVAAENDALPGGKVGGIGDVVRDLPPALIDCGYRVTVVTPAYGAFAELPGSNREAVIEVGFAGVSQHVEVYSLSVAESPALRTLVLEHPLFGISGRGVIYHDDPPDSPFATDASKFALFCASVCEGLLAGVFHHVDYLHLHDWHSGLTLALTRYHPAYVGLRSIPSVFSIHNLALQGVRPLANHPSAFLSWFPNLAYSAALGDLLDPRWKNCVNPMAVGVRMADVVHTVSPSYAAEIQQDSEIETNGFYGGEGLEADLRHANEQGRLHGILNGCQYPPLSGADAMDWPQLLDTVRAQLLRWVAATAAVPSAHFVLDHRLAGISAKSPQFLLTSVGRLTEQKVRLLREPVRSGRSALEELLSHLADINGKLILLGRGAGDIEQFLGEVAARYESFLFLRGYSDAIARALYACGDLFLMPSSFEPCGISQMLAMRAGQPCLVHAVGGLRDTVFDNHNGFSFSGHSLLEQAEAMVTTLQRATSVYFDEPERWNTIAAAAAASRFPWSACVENYRQHLYRPVYR